MSKHKQSAYDEALERIEASRRNGRPMLDLSSLGLTCLPPQIGQLTALKELNLHNNQLTSLPPELGRLTALTRLYGYNNQLTSLPPELGKLSALTQLSLHDNQLTTLPPEFGKLTALTELWLHNNQLTSLPPELGKLSELRLLDLSSNRLKHLPYEIAAIPNLYGFRIRRNPLPPELLKLADVDYGDGRKLLKYLRLLATAKAAGGQLAPKRFDEAKVLLVGPGEVGKSWLLRAMQGKVPKKIASTKGIEIAREPLDLLHPAAPGRTLHLNCWDFGGQDHLQITHQIFFSTKAVYLLVWKPRTGLDPELIARLERIELSAGKTAKVLIVSTHADGSVPAIIGQDALKERFGDLIYGFFETDSAKGPRGTGVAELRDAIAQAAAQLEGMDIEYPPQWHAARKSVMALAEPTVDFAHFATVCAKSGLDDSTAADLAAIMEVHGHAVFFADAAEAEESGMKGDNLVVLNPEWLAKAVGFVIEDKPTIAASGILLHDRLKTIWKKDTKRECPGYAKKLHGYLLWLMWKFDIAYKQDDHTSLVPQHIVRDRPDDLYWTPVRESQDPEATLVCRIPHNPPVGIIPALTAAVHPLRRIRDAQTADKLDRNWRDGFFLDTAVRGHAYVELQDRDLLMVVRDKYPANLISVVLKTLEEIIRVRWPRLAMDLRVPCIGKKDGKRCKGTHGKSGLEDRRGENVYCEKCGMKDLSADRMLDGFDAQQERVMEELRRLKAGQGDLLATAHAIFKSLDPATREVERAPCMFTILPNKGRVFSDNVRITCWCEHPDGPHPAAPIGSDAPPDYLLTIPKDWVVKVGPYISWAAVLLKAFVPLAGTVADQTFGQMPGADLKDTISLMNDASKAIPTGKLELGERLDMEGGLRSRPEIVALRHLHDFLLAKVKAEKRWGDLRPVQTKSGQILWLCEKHAAIQEPPVQEL